MGKYKTYDRIFKENVVKLSYEKHSLKGFAEEIGIHRCYITKWRQQYEKFGSGSFCGSGNIRLHPEKENLFQLEKKFKESELKLEILKKGHKYLFQGNLIIYQFIKDNENKYSITQMCKVLGIGINGYLKWKKNGVSKKREQIALLKEEITTIYFYFKKQYGGTKITRELQNRGYKIEKRRVSFYMQQLGLRSIAKRKFKITTNSKHNYYTAPNILNQKFKVDAPSKVWVSDITYIQSTNKFLYLTIIMDLYDRKIIGWSLSSRLSTRETTLTALKMAVKNRKILEGLIFHSDRGVQYANKIFTTKLDYYKCIRSMSFNGNHLDNAVAESFFSTLKKELIHKTKLLPTKKLKAEIFEFIENWYNKKRIHSTLNYKTIEEFNTINEQ